MNAAGSRPDLTPTCPSSPQLNALHSPHELKRTASFFLVINESTQGLRTPDKTGVAALRRDKLSKFQADKCQVRSIGLQHRPLRELDRSNGLQPSNGVLTAVAQGLQKLTPRLFADLNPIGVDLPRPAGILLEPARPPGHQVTCPAVSSCCFTLSCISPSDTEISCSSCSTTT